jgi:hypothetical protein
LADGCRAQNRMRQRALIASKFKLIILVASSLPRSRQQQAALCLSQHHFASPASGSCQRACSTTALHTLSCIIGRLALLILLATWASRRPPNSPGDIASGCVHCKDVLKARVAGTTSYPLQVFPTASDQREPPPQTRPRSGIAFKFAF